MTLYKNWYTWNNRVAQENVLDYIEKSKHNYELIVNYNVDSKFMEILSDDITKYSTLKSILLFLHDNKIITNYFKLDKILNEYIDFVDNNKEIYNKIIAISKTTKDVDDSKLLSLILKKYTVIFSNTHSTKLLKKLKEHENNISFGFRDDKSNIILLSEDEIQGVEQEIIKTFEKDINEKKYIIHLDDAIYKILMVSVKKSQIRKKIELFYSMKCYDYIGEISNLINIRSVLAKTNNFKNYPNMQNTESMINNFEQIMKFLTNCIDNSHDIFNKNIKILKNLKRHDVNENTSLDVGEKNVEFGTWDIDYYMNVCKNNFGLKNNYHFKFDHVIKSTLDIFENLFKIKFVKKNKNLWGQNVLFYVVTQNKNTIGKLYLDLLDRPNKVHKNACFVIESPCMFFDTKRVIKGSIVINTCFNNMLDYDDIGILFREFGYALHNIFGFNKYYLLSGINVPKDYIDLSCLLLEYICWDNKIIYLMANKNSSINDEIIQKMKYYKTLVNTIDFHRQLYYSVYDQLIYTNEFTKELQNSNQDDITSHFIYFNKYVHDKIYKNTIAVNEGCIMPYKLINNYEEATQFYSYLYPKIISANLLHIGLKSGSNFQELTQNIIIKLYNNSEHEKTKIINKLLNNKVDFQKYFNFNSQHKKIKENKDRDSEDLYQTETTETLKKYANIFSKN